MSSVLDLALTVTALSYVSFALFTKVEESFNLHATHDVLMYGVGPTNLPKYDHFTFPGAVPRSFVGSVILAWTTWASLRIGSWLGILSSLMSRSFAALRYSSFYDVIKVGLISGVLSAALTMLVDSYFWQQWPLWPELYGIYFNVLQGKSSKWGISPFHAYLTSYLPKLLLSSLPLSAVGLLSDSRIRALLLPYLAFILLISGLAHKEWRFVIYVVPAFNIAAARGAAWLTSRRKGSLFGRLCFLAVVACVAANCAAMFLLARSSFANYPGGAALRAFNQIYASEENVHVHICNLAAQTGASLFLHNNAPPFLPSLNGTHHTSWVYDKSKNLTLDDLTRSQEITHLIVEASSNSPSALAAKGWTEVAVVDGFDGWQFNWNVRSALKDGLFEGVKRLGGALEMVRSEKLIILKRDA